MTYDKYPRVRFVSLYKPCTCFISREQVISGHEQRKLIRFFINISGVLVIHDHLVKFWFNLLKKNIHRSNSTERFKNILRHELELKWIKRLQTPFPLGFNDNIYHERNISKVPNFDAFSLLDIKNVINNPMVSAKMAILNENIKLFYLFLI